MASKDHNPLVFSQQIAVNSILQQLMKGSGIFAVNGPPGTGKTTLLRDLITAVTVDRAIELSKLSNPQDAFIGEQRWKVGKYNRVISIWKEELRGFEIVVASNNNGAVENITLEIPGIESIDPSWISTTDYFPEIATRLIDQPAWAMIAARLGNKTNRNEFINRFWYGDKEAQEQNEENPSAQGFINILKSLENEPINWNESVNRFKKILQQEKNLRKDREAVFENYEMFFSLQKKIPKLEQEISDICERQDKAAHLHKAAQYTENDCSLNIEQAKASRLEHRKFRPGFIEILFSLGKAFRRWSEKDQLLASNIDRAEQNLNEAKKYTTDKEELLEMLKREFHKVSSDLEQKRALLENVCQQLISAKSHLGSFFPTPETWANKKLEEDREKSSPWVDNEWNNVRAKVFLEALRLHKAFITSNAGVMRKSLQGAMDILSGAIPTTAPQEGIAAAWTTLFFVIPVISTTFASFDRLFCHLGRESIGWLLIDEAGQAVPQSAVGAIWRAKRSVVVGDPLQLEPVVTIPMTVQEYLRKYYQVEKIWMPGNTSVQQLADRVNRIGTYVKSQQSLIWVGSPLRVHRRCDQPMFTISNQVAYGGLMVFGTPPRSKLNLPVSSWLEVVSVESEGHWIPAEGRALEKLLHDLLNRGVQPEKLFLISPFRAVVRQLRQISTRFPNIKVGTIHTVQGKEADVVILILGGDPNRPGAKQWASASPNLLNVAVSRAKRRLYVIGNREMWKGYQFFNICAFELKE